MVVRFRTEPGLGGRTRAVVDDWPVVAVVGGYRVHRPVPQVAPAR